MGSDSRSRVLLGVNVNLQYASIPKRDRSQMVSCLESLLGGIAEERFSAALYFTGVSAEWLASERPDIVSMVVRLNDEGLIEIGSHTYAHAVLTLFPERDQIWQVAWGERAIEAAFGRPPVGLFVPEFGFSRATAASIASERCSEYVVGPLGPRPLDAFWVDAGLPVVRPAAVASKRLKRFLMAETPPPILRPPLDYCLVADAEYPYFAGKSGADAEDRWPRALRTLRSRHEPVLIGTYLAHQRLPVRAYNPRIPPKHRDWFQGIREYDERLAQIRRLLDRDGAEPDREAVRGLLLAENSDAYECMTQGYRGHGWDDDARAAAHSALARLVTP